MITFLKCKANAYMKLKVLLSYQKDNKIKDIVLDIDQSKEYKISITDNDYGLLTTTCRIIGFTLTNSDSKSIINKETKPYTVDTITIDCSSDGESKVIKVNVSDIRFLEEINKDDFEDMTNIKEFK